LPLPRYKFREFRMKYIAPSSSVASNVPTPNDYQTRLSPEKMIDIATPAPANCASSEFACAQTSFPPVRAALVGGGANLSIAIRLSHLCGEESQRVRGIEPPNAERESHRMRTRWLLSYFSNMLSMISIASLTISSSEGSSSIR